MTTSHDAGREAIARMIALAGLGTITGQPRELHGEWTREDFEARILTIIPTHCEQQCFALADRILEATRPPAQAGAASGEVDGAGPIPMILHCPRCHVQHIDEPDERTPEWDNPPHRSHLCHACGCIWRPADVPTEGVARITTVGKADTPLDVTPAASGEDYAWRLDRIRDDAGPLTASDKAFLQEAAAFLRATPAASGEGCTCQGCGRLYRVDIMVDDDIWEKIKPEGKAIGAGLLCGACIAHRIEALDRFDALHLTRNPAASGEIPGGMVAWNMVTRLRDEEADSVTILCDNPDGPPNNAVECCGFWTGFVDKRFEGDTINDALASAVAAKDRAASVGYPDPATPKASAETSGAGDNNPCRNCGTEYPHPMRTAANTPPDELARIQLLADVELHLQSVRIFLTKREKMHPCGVDLHDELQARVTSALSAAPSAPATEAGEEA